MARPALIRGGLAAAMGALAVLSPAQAQTDVRGALELEGRWFDVRDGDGLSGSVAGLVDIYRPLADPDLSLIAELFYRRDSDDPHRSHGDVRQAFVQAVGRSIEINAGYRRVFWGVTESRSLVDIINQSDLVEDIDGGAKLGQPMLQLRWLAESGTGDLFILPAARQRTFPGPEGHPRIPFPIARGASRFPDGEQRRLDYALRWQWRLPDIDLGVSWFDGTARDPDMLPCLAQGSDFPGTAGGPNCDLEAAAPQLGPLAGALVDVLQVLRLAPGDDALEAAVRERVLDNLVLVPDYGRTRRAGLDLQVLRGGLALRLEALARHRDGEWTFASVSGLEYTLPGFFATDWDVGVLAEHLYDQRDDNVFSQRFANDVFVGTRISFNDLAGSTLLAGAIVEPDLGNRLFSVELSRRFLTNWRVTLDARVLSDVPDDPLVDLIDGQDRVRLQLQRFF